MSLPLVGDVNILGLETAHAIIDGARAALPQDASERVALEQVSRFARLAADNLDVSKPILASIGSPVQIKTDDRRTAAGRRSTRSRWPWRWRCR